MLREITDTISTYFKSIEEAYEFFADNEATNEVENDATISREQFTKAIRKLFQLRFTSNDIETLWQ